MKKTLILIIVLILVLVIVGCSATPTMETQDSNEETIVEGLPLGEHTEDIAKQSRLDAFEKLLSNMANDAKPVISNEDINNPNKVTGYYLYSEQEALDMVLQSKLIIDIDEEKNIDLLLRKVPQTSAKQCNFPLIWLIYSPESNTFDISWIYGEYIRESENDEFNEISSLIAHGNMNDIDAGTYTKDIEFPDIVDFEILDTPYADEIDKSTIRKSIINLSKIAINEMVCKIEELGIKASNIGFESYVPEEFHVNTRDELLNISAEIIKQKYAEYIGEISHNGYSQLYVYLTEESGFDKNTTIEEEKWNSFLHDCVDVFYSNMPDMDYSYRDITSEGWDIIFFDCNEESITDAYIMYDYYNNRITYWSDELKEAVPFE